uniref:hypothetical protein n=1 Tax=Rhizobium laguerreae TaxID=1076926 RepID=UPI001FE3D098|nr:hypothetical protein [Rhizobium laguerreae]
MRFDVNRDTVAIPFDLGRPLIAVRGARFQEGETGFDAPRHGVEEKVRLRRITAAPRLRPGGSISVLEKRF